jgi:hypothetical protein
MPDEIITEPPKGAVCLFIETLEKLENFKRFIIALLLTGIFGLSVLALSALIALSAYKGNIDLAVEAAKWLIALLATIIGTVTGFYFGSHISEVKTDAKV